METRSPFSIPRKGLRRAGALLPAVLLLLAAAAPAAAQPASSQASGFAVSPPVSALPPDEGTKPNEPGEVKTVPIKTVRFETGDPDAVSQDPVVQDAPVTAA